MATTKQPVERRADGLSKEQIVRTAIDILDADGEGALTFRVLATRLATGPGAIYHYVSSKSDLMAAAAEEVIGRLLIVAIDTEPREAIRALTLGVFDAFTAHPWVGAQLAREPWIPVVRVFEAIGGQIQALGIPEAAQFNAASAVLNYMLGAAGQNAANARLVPPGTERLVFLEAVTDKWLQHPPEEYPFVHQVAGQLRDHDDREQFLAGVNLILAGAEALRR